MMRHLLRLAWARKRHNVLLLIEVFCSFLVLLGVMVLAVQYALNYRHPLGFDIHRTWRIGLEVHARRDPGASAEATELAAARATTDQLQRAVVAMPEVESVTFAFTAPYENASWTSGVTTHGREFEYGMNEVTDSFRDVVDLKMLRGRFFNREDDGAPWHTVVLNAQLAQEMLGSIDVIGKTIQPDANPRWADLPPDQQADLRRGLRVVGVFEDFRQEGELGKRQPFMLQRMDLADPKQGAPRLMLIRVRPGTTASFEEVLVGRMASVARDWSFNVQPVSDLRTAKLRIYLMPLVGFGVVAGFLLLMVAMGLTGVLWQSVTQRTREIGLRRAKGATRQAVHAQIVGELAVVTTLAIAAAVALVAQVPLLPVSPSVIPDRTVMAISLALSAVVIYGITLACAYYPSHMATRVEPADALRYE